MPTPQAGDIVLIDRTASVQFARSAMWFRIRRIRDTSLFTGWLWLEGNDIGRRTKRRWIYVNGSDLRTMSVSEFAALSNTARARKATGRTG